MKRLLLRSAVLLLFAGSSAAQTADELRSKIKSAVENREYIAAIETLQKFRDEDRKRFDANNYDYLLARIAEKSGDFALAMSNYQAVAGRNSVLKSYALWHLSQLARTTGNLMLERIYLLELSNSSPESLLNTAANNRMPRSFFESKNYPEAIRLLNAAEPSQKAAEPNPKATPTALARENLSLLAEAYLRSNRTNEARDLYTKLLNELPNPAQPDDIALAAVRGLDVPDAGASATAFADTEHLRRASVYQFNRDFAGARLHYQAIIDNFPQSGIMPDAIYQIGRGYVQQAELVEALKWFERVQEQFPDHPSSKDALSQAASAYSKLAKYKEAIARYKKYIEKYPDDERLDRAYLNIVDIYRDQGYETDALKWAASTEQAFKGKLPETIAIFTEARIYMARSDWANALAALDRLKTAPDLGGIKMPGGTNTAEVNFLRAYILEQMQRYDEAVDLYLSIPDGRAEYYGGRATERLRLLANNEPARSAIVQKAALLNTDAKSKDSETERKSIQALIRLTDSIELREKLLGSLKEAYKSLPNYQKIPSLRFSEIGRRELLNEASTGTGDHKQIANELLFLGLYDEAAPELEASLISPGEAKSGDMAYTLAVIYKRGDMANRAVAFIEPLWRNVPADFQVELIPREQLEMLYPAPYADSLLKYASPRDVDPRFVLSIMRQESRYRADIKSYAAARGLMQFISTTSDKIAGELGRNDFRQDELYFPPTAILFGSQYLADLFKLFPNQPAAVAASYNGGDDNMQRWLNRSKSNSPDNYVPEIIFSQSKDYVYKVMANYRMYQMLYDENLKVH